MSLRTTALSVFALASIAVGAIASGTGDFSSGQADGAPRQVAAFGEAAQAATAPSGESEDDLEVDRAEPDFTVIDLPTNLRLPQRKLDFRLTHRFGRPLGEGSFSDLASDLFGFDGGAQIGLGLRFGLLRGTQLGVYRTSDRTIQFHAQQELLRERPDRPGVSLLGSLEGGDNFSEEYSPSLALVLSKKLADRAAVYLVPSWVGHTRTDASAAGSDENTFVLGVGARLRVGASASLVAEVHPRLAGYKGDLGSGDPDSLAVFGLEGRVGGHSFQLNFGNALGTTPAQVARGAQGLNGWFIGFNLTRKFY